MRVLSKGSKVSKGEKPKWGGKRAVKSPVRKRTTAKTAERKKKAKNKEGSREGPHTVLHL